MAVAGCGPEEMGIGPVFAIPKLLERNGLTIDDIGIWELNEAFASQVLYCRDKLGIPDDKLNVSGGSISIGHPYGMTGARCTAHLMYEASAAAPSTVSSPCASAAAWAPPVVSRFSKQS
jgi:acetyl-CoA C-acetyltransferase